MVRRMSAWLNASVIFALAVAALSCGSGGLPGSAPTEKVIPAQDEPSIEPVLIDLDVPFLLTGGKLDEDSLLATEWRNGVAGSALLSFKGPPTNSVSMTVWACTDATCVNTHPYWSAAFTTEALRLETATKSRIVFKTTDTVLVGTTGGSYWPQFAFPYSFVVTSTGAPAFELRGYEDPLE